MGNHVCSWFTIKPKSFLEVRLKEITLDKGMDMIDSGSIMDATNILILQYAKLHNLV